MKLLDFIKPAATVHALKARDKKGVIKELIDALVENKVLAEEMAAAAHKAIMKREAIGSTGIGRGVGIPHARLEGVPDTLAVLGRSDAGVDFASIDGEPAYVFFLLLSPSDKPDPHLKALEHISKVLRDDHFCRFLTKAASKKELNELLAEADQKFFS